MHTRRFAWLITILFALTLLPACGGSGADGEGSPNDPQLVDMDEFIDGDLAAFTSETYNFTITDDTFISVELYGARLDQQAWSATTFNAPVIRLVDRSTPFPSPVVAHDVNDATWLFGPRDTEIPLYFLEKTVAGAPQTFSIIVERQSPATEGGPFKLRINNLTDEINAQLGGFIEENELRGQFTNGSFDDLSETPPETISPLSDNNNDILVLGHYEDNGEKDNTNFESDYFKINIDPPTDTAIISCFEIFASRNGIWDSQNAYFDPEIRFLDPDDIPLNTVDDAFFLDSKACQKVTTPGDYKVEITKSFSNLSNASSDYLLKYTEESISSIVDEGESNGTSSSASVINFGTLVSGSLSDSSPAGDWFSISADAGDMIAIRQFDFENSVDSNGRIIVEVFESDGTTEVPFNGPAPEGAGGDGRVADLYADLTTTFFAETSQSYKIHITIPESLGPINYSFIVDRVKQSTPESVLNDTVANATLIGLTDRGFGQISPESDVDFFRIDATNIVSNPGDLIAVHIYATRDPYVKAFDITGFGSDLKPELTVFDDSISTITSSRYFSLDSGTGDVLDVLSEGIIEPFPTLTAVFEDTGSSAYYFRVDNVEGTTGPYMIEVVNLGQ